MDLPAAHASLVAALYRLRNADGGWPYYVGRKSRLEATCWAALGTGVSVETTPIAGWMDRTGLLVEPATGRVNYAFNGLASLVMSQGNASGSPIAQQIVGALGDSRSARIPPAPNIRQDNSLQGWPWDSGTFSWVEPTAWCLLAVKRHRNVGQAMGPRIHHAEAVLKDRACPGGGWNYGNAEVYGHALPAHVPPTAIGALALQDRPLDQTLKEAVAVLERQGPAEGSTTALALSALALSTLGQPVAHLGKKLADHHAEAVSFGNVMAIGMAAYALDCVINDRTPRALDLRGVRA